MEQVTHIFAQPHTFSLAEASRLLPLICRITSESSHAVQELIDHLDSVGSEDEDFVNATENEINRQIQCWQTKIEKLGAHPKGLWVVDFDFGEGYYCWKYPEKEILYWHRHNEGFAQRTRIKVSEDFVVGEKSR